MPDGPVQRVTSLEPVHRPTQQDQSRYRQNLQNSFLHLKELSADYQLPGMGKYYRLV